MAKCPTCGGPMPSITSGETLAGRMRELNIGLYQGQDHQYYLERGYGQIQRATIDDALSRGLIVPRWEDAPHLEYWKAAPADPARHQ